MFSVTTSANSAVLASLRQINNDLQVTQTRIGTGKKINSASDNPSVWATVTSLKGDITSNDAISSTIALAKSKVDAGSAAVTQVSDLLTQMKTASDTYTSSAKTASDLSSATAKISALQTQITSLITNATFQGKNMLNNTTALAVSVGSDSNGAAVTMSVTPTDLTAGATAAATGAANSTDANVIAVSGLAASAITAVTSYQATLSTFSSVLGSQQDYIKTIQSIRQTAIDGLVDADLSAESAKVTALQTQQQLAYQALSIGNSSGSGILRLFQ